MSSKQASGGDKNARARAANRILIVDDEESLAFFLKQSLLEMSAAWEIDTASTGEEAVLKINRGQYGLIIADLKMPALSGLELLQMVHALEPNTRVILMTAYGSEKVEKEAKRLNVYRYVTKPFRTEDMKQWAKDALREFEQAIPRLPRPSSKETVESQSRKLTQEMIEKPAPITKKATPATAAPPQNRVLAYLVRLRFLLGAQLVFLANAQGQVLARVGALPELDVTQFASLVVSEFQSTLASGAALGADSTTMIVQSGQKYSASSLRVGGDGVLVIMFDRAAQAAQWDLWPNPIRRAAEELSSLIAEEANAPLTEGVGNRDVRQERRELSYAPFSDIAQSVTSRQSKISTRREPDVSPSRERVEIKHQIDEWTEEAEDFAVLSGGISIEDARMMGIISDDVLSRLISDESEKS